MNIALNLLTWPTRISQSRIRVNTFVSGEPISKQRPRFCITKSGKPYTPKHTKEAEQAIAWAIKAAHHQIVEDHDSLFGVRLLFCCKNSQRRDIDNMSKLILDACNGFVWRDDTQVVELHACVLRDEPERMGTSILIYTIPGTAHRVRICVFCGREYPTYPSWSERKFCSNLCRNTASRTGFQRECAHCGKTIYRQGHRQSKKFYCSHE